MPVLCDTNILLRSLKPDHEHHEAAKLAIARLHHQHRQLVLVPQCLYEFYVVATRPTEVNGLGLTSEAALQDIQDFRKLFRVLRDERSVLEHWIKLIDDSAVVGKRAHDARIVAAMNRHGVDELLTFNASDFRRFGSITVRTPQEVLA